MSEVRYVKVANHCVETILVYLRHRRPKKESSLARGRRTHYSLCPERETPPLAYHLLVGAKGWESLSSKKCIEIYDVPHEPRFAQIQNISGESITIELAPAKEAGRRARATVTVQPDESSKAVDLGSVTERSKLSRLAEDKKISINPILEIGPPTGRKGAVASYVGESVYVCYKCGGPIIFRFSPAVPIHL